MPTPRVHCLRLSELYIPAHRFEKLRPERAPFCHIAAKSDGGAGNSHHLAQIDLVGTLHINLFHACPRSGAVDLDTRAAQIAFAICLVLLEDTTFLELFAHVSGLRFRIDDGVAKGDQGSDYDCVLVQIELEMAEGQLLFEPQQPVCCCRASTRDWRSATTRSRSRRRAWSSNSKSTFRRSEHVQPQMVHARRGHDDPRSAHPPHRAGEGAMGHGHRRVLYPPRDGRRRCSHRRAPARRRRRTEFKAARPTTLHARRPPAGLPQSPAAPRSAFR